jgi:hypothetical protein
MPRQRRTKGEFDIQGFPVDMGPSVQGRGRAGPKLSRPAADSGPQRRAGIPQVIRMKISGHKTDSVERRYNIVDHEDWANARDLLERRQTAAES